MAKNWKRKTLRVLREYRDLQRQYLAALARAEDEKRRADMLQTLVVVMGVCTGALAVLWILVG